MPAPIYSEQTLAELALRKLGALDFGQTVPAEQMQVIQDKIPGMLEDLATRGIYQASDVTGVQVSAWDYMGAVLAYYCRDDFGISGESLQRVIASNMDAESKLRTLSRRNDNPDKMRVDRALYSRRRWFY